MTPTRAARVILYAMASGLIVAPAVGGAAQRSEIPAGARFVVELRDTLDARKVKRGKKFEARTLEALRADDGSIVDADAKLKGRVSHADNDRLVLRFEQIESRRGKSPIVATVVGVMGERGVRHEAGPEGEIRASGGRGRSAAIGAAIGAGLGAAAGTAKGGGKETAIGAGAGAAAGAAIGAAAGGKDLVLDRGARIELRLDRPLTLKR